MDARVSPASHSIRRLESWHFPPLCNTSRYRSSPLLYAWQVENEPFDYVVNDLTGADQITAQQLSWEIAQVHELDPHHEVVTTTFDGWNVSVDMLQLYAPLVLAGLGGYPSGHPEPALSAHQP